MILFLVRMPEHLMLDICRFADEHAWHIYQHLLTSTCYTS